MTGTFSVFVRGTPAPKGSKRAFKAKNGRAFVVDTNDKSLKAWESAVRFVLQNEWRGGAPFAGAVEVHINFSLLRPASVSAKRRPWPIVKPDIDKLVRAILDPLTGIVLKDDAQVCDLQVTKEYALESGVTIFVKEL